MFFIIVFTANKKMIWLNVIELDTVRDILIPVSLLPFLINTSLMMFLYSNHLCKIAVRRNHYLDSVKEYNIFFVFIHRIGAEFHNYTSSRTYIGAPSS